MNQTSFGNLVRFAPLPLLNNEERFTVLLPEVEIKKVIPSELEFFGNVRDMKKNYLNPLEKFRWD